MCCHDFRQNGILHNQSRHPVRTVTSLTF